jgi:hypothetical protein
MTAGQLSASDPGDLRKLCAATGFKAVVIRCYRGRMLTTGGTPGSRLARVDGPPSRKNR